MKRLCSILLAVLLLFSPVMTASAQTISQSNGTVADVQTKQTLSAPRNYNPSHSVSGEPLLYWDYVAAADSYQIYRSEKKSSGYKKIGTVPNESGSMYQSYWDESAELGKTYFYKIRSANEDQTVVSGFSNVVQSVCILPAPKVTVSVNLQSGKPVVTWNTVEDADMYLVYRLETRYGAQERIYKAIRARSFEDTTARAGCTYYYRVKAVHENKELNSVMRDPLYARCRLSVPPFQVSLNKNGVPKITWDTVEDAVKYRIYRSETEDGTFEFLKTAIKARSFTDTAAEEGKTYYYKMRAIYGIKEGNSTFSAPQSITAK